MNPSSYPTMLFGADANSFEPLGVALVISAVMMLVLIFGLAVLFSKFYQKPPADHAIILTGKGGLRAATGTGIWVIPILHRAESLSLAPMRVELPSTKLDAESAKSLGLPNVYQVAVGPTREMILLAGQQLLSMPTKDIIVLTQDHILAELDSFLAQENDGASEDPPADQFVKRVESSLNTLGLTVIVARRA